MAAKGTIGGKIVLEGEKGYREALKSIKQEQSELRSEMKLCQQEFEGAENSIEALTKKHEILSKQVDAQNEKIKIYNDAIEKNKEKQEKATEKINSLSAELKQANEKMKQLKDSSEEGSEAVKEQAEVIEKLEKNLSVAKEGYVKAEQKTKAYQTAVNYANIELNNMKEQQEQAARYMQEAEKSADQCATSIDEYGKEVKDAANQTSVFGDVLKANLASEAIIAGVKRLAEGVKEIAEGAVEVGTEFEASMSNVAATMGMTAEEINAGSKEYEKLAASAKQCGQTTKFSASESADALNYLALAGYDVEKSVATLPKVLDLAAAGGLDLAYASDLVTDSMAAMNMGVDKLDGYIDQMAKTSQKSNTSIAQLGEATLVCAGTVTLTEQKLETMNAELGILANNGIKGAEGGTHLRNILLALSAPTEKAESALHKLRVEVEDSEGNMRDLNAIMTDLNGALAGMSSTEKTQFINKIFNKTDIAAVNALLKGTGEEFDNLEKELKNCSGAAANMAETMNNNLKGKITILKSSMEALGISAYEVFDDDMKTAVDGATDAVGRLQQSIEKGDLGVSLNKMSKALGEFLEGAVDVGEDALPVLIDGLTWILDNADIIIAGIAGITAANIQMKVVAPAIEVVTAAWTTYKTANEGATVSQWLLNTAMNANPAGILLTAVTALTAAVAAYILINKDNIFQIDETTQKTKELVEESKRLNEQYESSISEKKSSREEMENEKTAVGKLVDELKELQAKTELTSNEQDRQKMIIEELNGTLPGLNLAIDEQTGLLNMSTEALEKNVEAMMAMDRANAAREDMAELAQEQYEAEKQLAELEEQLADQKREVAAAQEEYNSKLEHYGEIYGTYSEMCELMTSSEQEALRVAKEGQAELEEQITATKDSISGFTEAYYNCVDCISEDESMAKAAADTGMLGEAARAATSDLTDMTLVTSEAFQEMYDSVSEAVTDQMNLFSQFKGEAELSTKELLSNMESQVVGLTQWADNMEQLADRGINQGLLKHLADMGPEGAGYVAAFVSMTDEELQKANKLFEQSLAIPDETAGKIAEAFEEAGTNAAEGFQNGIADGTEAAAEAAGEMGQAAIDTTEETIDSHSPSKEFKKIGGYIVDGLIAGIEEGSEAVADAAKTMAQGSIDAAMDTLDAHSPSKEFEKIGGYIDEGLIAGIKGSQKDVTDIMNILCTVMLQTGIERVTVTDWAEIGRRIPEGLATGIRSGQSNVANAIRDMCTSAVAAAKRELDVNSPSKKFEYMGEMSGEGYIVGWKSSMADAAAAVEASMQDVERVAMRSGDAAESTSETGSRYNINQKIEIYAPMDDPIEAEKSFRDAQREAAKGW